LDQGQAAAAVSAPVTVRSSGGGSSVSMDDLATVKGLLDRLGSKGLEKLVSIIS
jgi:carbon monoxide dehydrogenase subunit G